MMVYPNKVFAAPRMCCTARLAQIVLRAYQPELLRLTSSQAKAKNVS